MLRIQSLPTRYEPLAELFGSQTPSTFVKNDADLEEISRLLSRAESGHQGKILFLFGLSGAGKSTLIESLSVFLSSKVERVERLPDDSELPVEGIAEHIGRKPRCTKFTIINMDGREAPSFNEDQYRNFLIQLNQLLRSRSDIVIIWPINLRTFGDRVAGLLTEIGGRSPFGAQPVYEMHGIGPDLYGEVLNRILSVANSKLEDAAIEQSEADDLARSSRNIGNFLAVQQLISDRFDSATNITAMPKLVFAISSGEKEIRRHCRALRRADNFYLEASRLLMYTKRSNVAEWWGERSKTLSSALPFVISLFDAHLVSISTSRLLKKALARRCGS